MHSVESILSIDEAINWEIDNSFWLGFHLEVQTKERFWLCSFFFQQIIWKWFIFGEATPEQEISAIYIFDTRSKRILTKIMQMNIELI